MSHTDGSSDPTYEPGKYSSFPPSPESRVPYIPPSPGMPAPRFCPGCGAPLMLTAVVCPHCGTAVGSPRSKGVAILLAVFLSFWTWLYTYEQDKVKFWWGLGLTLVGGLLSLFFVGIVMIFGVWLWAVITAATKSEEAYRVYPNGA